MSLNSNSFTGAKGHKYFMMNGSRPGIILIYFQQEFNSIPIVCIGRK